MAAIKERLRYFKNRVAPLVRLKRRSGFVAHIAKLGKLEEWHGCNPKALDAATQYFGLNAASAEDRELLAYILADVVFGRRRGRPKDSKVAWDNNRLLKLFAAYEQCKRANPALSDSAVAKQISKTREFSKNDPDQIRQRLGSAKAAKSWLDGRVKNICDGVQTLAKWDPKDLDLEDLRELYRSLCDLLEHIEPGSAERIATLTGFRLYA